MGVMLDEVLSEDTTTSNQDPIFSHIVDRGDDPRPAAAIVMEAMVMGTSITALCGHFWVPSRNPEKFPICPKCAEIFEFARDFRGV